MIHLTVLKDSSVNLEHDFDGPLEVGRQQLNEGPPFAVIRTASGSRLVIAPMTENTVARRQLRITPRGNGTVLVENLSRNVDVARCGSEPLPVQQQRTVSLPVELDVAGRTVRIEEATKPAAEPPGYHALRDATIAPGQLNKAVAAAKRPLISKQAAQPEEMLRLCQVVLEAVQDSSSSDAFYENAARAVVELCDLESARVLTLQEGRWSPVARFDRDDAEGSPELSQTVIDRVVMNRRTFWTNRAAGEQIASLVRTTGLVAAPILDEDGDVTGILYGETSAAIGQDAITELHATLVDIIAGSVASGIARLRHQEEALEFRLKFEQFFTKALCGELEKNPNLLEGRDAHVSVLFCDVRGFSRISERLTAQRTFEWMNDVLGQLSECVTEHNGVLVDYIGDELMAMWGAPVIQTDHARLACRAALAMLGRIDELNERWRSELGEPISIGIGINSGAVRAGNTGSAQKFKYGPLGHAVNLASRVEGATKHLRAPLIITGATHELLPDGFSTRRLCDVRVVNIREPVRLYELLDPNQSQKIDLVPIYEKALREFESQNFQRAVSILGTILESHPDDGASVVLMTRSSKAMLEPTDQFDHVWRLDSK